MPLPDAPDGFPYHQWHRLVRRRLPLAAEVAASRPDRRAWVSVRSIPEGGYHLWYFEVERDHYEEVVAAYDWDLHDRLLDQQRVNVKEDVELVNALSRWLPDLTVLVDPGLSTIPI